MAWQLVRHAFVMIFSNLGQALRVSVFPYALLIAAAVIVFTTSGIPFNMNPEQMGAVAGSGSTSFLTFLLLIALMVFAIFVFGWVAVSWHRFILREEYSGMIPAVTDRPIWPYVGRSMWLGLLVTLIAIPVFMVVGLVSIPLAQVSMVFPFLAMFAGFVLIAYLWMRWAIALPSIAIGEEMKGSDAWAETAPHSQTIFFVVLILMAFNIIPPILLESVYQAAPIIGFVIDVVIQWVIIMLSLSILTTLYGHIVEGRPLVD